MGAAAAPGDRSNRPKVDQRNGRSITEAFSRNCSAITGTCETGVSPRQGLERFYDRYPGLRRHAPFPGLIYFAPLGLATQSRLKVGDLLRRYPGHYAPVQPARPRRRQYTNNYD